MLAVSVGTVFATGATLATGVLLATTACSLGAATVVAGASCSCACACSPSPMANTINPTISAVIHHRRCFVRNIVMICFLSLPSSLTECF